MVSQVVENKIVKLSIDDASLTKGLQKAVTGLKGLDTGVKNVKFDNFDKGGKSAMTLGERLGNLVSKIPIIGNLAQSILGIGKSSDESGNRVGALSGGFTGLISRIPIIGNIAGAILGIGKSALTSSEQIAQMGGSNFSDIESGAHSASGAVSGVGIAASKAGAGFSILAGAAAVALGGIAQKAISTGATMLKHLTVEPIMAGFKDYEEELESTRILTSALGNEATPAIKAAMRDLENYAGTTRYNVQQMNSSLAQFVNAGVGLKDANVAIKGWGNLAASAGASTQQFGASLQFGVQQALQMGKMTAQNWMSIENANMATEKFKTTLMDVGRELGENVPEDMGMFRESLQEGWITNEVLIESLKRLSEDQSMKKLAENVYTFGEAMEVIEEGTVNAWSRVWRALIGEGEDAVNIWSPLAENLGNAFAAPAVAVEKLADSFNKIGGRAVVIEAVKTAWESLGKIFNVVSEAFKKVFPQSAMDNAKSLKSFIEDLIPKLKIGESTLNAIGSAFELFFNIIKIGLSAIKSFGTLLSKLIPDNFISTLSNGIKYITSFVNSIIESFSVKQIDLSFITEPIKKLGNWLSSFKGSEKTIDNFTNSIKSLGSALSTIMGKSLVNISDSLVPIFNNLIDIVLNTVDRILESFNKLNVSTLLKGGFLMHLIKKFGELKKSSEFLDTLKDSLKGLFDSLSDISGNAVDVLNSVKDVLSDYGKQIKSEILKNIAIAVGILAASILVLSLIPKEKLMNAINGLSAVAAILLVMQKLMSNISSKNGILGSISTVIQLTAMVGAILVLSISLKILSTIPWDGILKGLTGLGVIIAMLLGTVFVLSNIDTKSSIKGIGSLILLAISVRILVSSLEEISNLSWEELKKGLIGLNTVMLALGITVGIINKTGGTKITSGLGILLMVISIKMLANELEDIGSLDADSIIKGLLGIGGIMLELVVLSKLMSNISFSNGMSLLMVAGTILILSKTLKEIGNLDAATIIKGLVTIAGGLTILVAALKLAKGSVANAMSLYILSGALKSLGLTIAMIGSLSWESVGKGLLGLGAGLAIVIAAGAGAQMVALGLLALGVSIGLIGAGIGLAGAGILAFGTGLTLLATIASSSIPIIAENIVVFLETLGNSSERIAESAAKLISGFVIGLAKGFSDSLSELGSIITNIINTVSDLLLTNIPILLNTLFTILSLLLTAFTQKIPELVVQIGTAFITLINSIATFINENQDQISAAITNVITAIFNLFVAVITGIFGGLGGVFKIIFESDIWQGIVESFNNFVTGIYDWGQKIDNKLKEGIDSAKKDVSDAAGRVWEGAKKIWDGAVGTAKGVGSKIGNSVSSGISSMVGAAKNAGNNIWNGAKGIWNGAVGTARGIGSSISNKWSDGISSAKNAASNAGKSVWNGVKNALSSMSGLWDSGKAIVDKWVGGLMSAFEGAVGKVSGWVGKIRGLFPNSPAKWGPLSGSGWTKLGRSGIAFFDQLKIGYDKGADRFIGGLGSTVSEMATIMDSVMDMDYNDFNITPVIRPELDMEAIESVSPNMLSAKLGVVEAGINIDYAKLNTQTNSAYNQNTTLDNVIDGMNIINNKLNELVGVNMDQTDAINQGKYIINKMDSTIINKTLAPGMIQAQKDYTTTKNMLGGIQPSL